MYDYLTSFYSNDSVNTNLSINWGNGVSSLVSIKSKANRIVASSTRPLTHNLITQLYGKLTAENFKKLTYYYAYDILGTYQKEPMLDVPVTVHYEKMNNVIDTTWRLGSLAYNTMAIRKIPFKLRHHYSDIHLAVQENGITHLFKRPATVPARINYSLDADWSTVKTGMYLKQERGLCWYLLSTVPLQTKSQAKISSSLIKTNLLSASETNAIHDSFYELGFYNVISLDDGFVAFDDKFCLLLGMISKFDLPSKFSTLFD